MKTKKNQTVSKLSGEQIVQQKLNRVNEILKKVDLSKLPVKTASKQDN
ncbi:hypothetical protein [Dyadobacter psychrotolerans]|nr:hypothetical protein [Dyadobacter psychrotolerans]